MSRLSSIWSFFFSTQPASDKLVISEILVNERMVDSSGSFPGFASLRYTPVL
jgi:hypothetical protein